MLASDKDVFTPNMKWNREKKKLKCEIYRDSMQNYKKYAIPPAQLIIADVPYNVGNKHNRFHLALAERREV